MALFALLFLHTAIFALAEVRQAARNGTIDNDELDIVSTPVATGSIVKAFDRNRSFFQSQLKTADYEFLSSLSRNTDVDADVNAIEDALSNAEDGEQDRKKKALELINSVSIDYFGDDNVESECLYMVTRSPMSKRITLIFRGSTTVQDWIKDSKVVVSDIENPVSDRPNQLPMIGVHKGFREYLYGESTTVKAEASCKPIMASLSDEDDETTTTIHNLQRASTTIVTGTEVNDDNIELLIEPDCTNNDHIHSKKQSDIDPSAGDGNLLPIIRNTTSELLNYLGLDLSTVKEKQKNLWNSMRWNGTTPITSHEKEDVCKINKTSTDHAMKKSRLARILDEIMHLQMEYDDYRIYITGHSLGGALGLLAALEVAERFGKADQPVTFVGVGNPRAGTEVSFRPLCKSIIKTIFNMTYDSFR